VSTLAALALPASQAAPGTRVLAAIDARMGELYVGAFQQVHGRLASIEPERLTTADQVTLDGAGWHGVGTGFAAQDGALAARFAPSLASVRADALPHAADVARIALQSGDAIAAERVEPAYLRDNVALTLVEQQALRDSKK
jgi:tRNA threonylcarbamoyladenosine biosynthesis protein TsaB